MSEENFTQILNQAESLYTAEQVDQALSQMCESLTVLLQDCDNPIFTCIMNGGLYTTSQLISRIDKPHLQFDYLHASRYQGEVAGSSLVWTATPSISMHDRTIVLVDDIFDEGITIAEIVRSCKAQGAAKIIIAVLTLKMHDRRAVDITPDVIGLEIPDRYVFGCGMDYKNHFRHLNEIYAVKGL